MNNLEPKSELQPVHRIFLGELFAFVFFFAGTLSILVGPFAVPLESAAIAIGASVVLSSLSFLWLAFTTPMRKPEPRYAFMALSLMPAAMICAGVVAVQSFKDAKSGKGKMIQLSVLSLKKYGANPKALSTAQTQLNANQLFADEIAALKEELQALNFDAIDASQNLIKIHTRNATGIVRNMNVIEVLTCSTNSTKEVGEYSFDVQLVVRIQRPGMFELKEELLLNWTKNMEARKAAKEREGNLAH